MSILGGLLGGAFSGHNQEMQRRGIQGSSIDAQMQDQVAALARQMAEVRGLPFVPPEPIYDGEITYDDTIKPAPHTADITCRWCGGVTEQQQFNGGSAVDVLACAYCSVPFVNQPCHCCMAPRDLKLACEYCGDEE